MASSPAPEDLTAPIGAAESSDYSDKEPMATSTKDSENTDLIVIHVCDENRKVNRDFS